MARLGLFSKTASTRPVIHPAEHEPACLAARLNLYLILATIALHGLVMLVNELFFVDSQFLKGINWIYLPAGTRLLCTLLFGGAGAIGLLIAGWFACYWYYFPGDALRATMGTIAGAIGPYLVYLVARRLFGLKASLSNLNARRLLLCAVGCSLASPLLHHLWFAAEGEAHLLSGLVVMFIGDLAGTLVVVYTAKGLLALLPAPDRAIGPGSGMRGHGKIGNEK